MKRRAFIRATTIGTTAALLGSGLKPRPTFAAEWPKRAFSATSANESLEALYGTREPIESDEIDFRAPVQVEDGALVPIVVSTRLPDVESIAIIVDRNPRPLVSKLTLNGAEAFFGVQLKLRESSEVRCLVRAGGGLYVKKRLIRVTVGGYDS